MRTWNRVLCLGAVLLLGACSNADPVVRFADDALSVPESAGTVTVSVVINPASASDVAIPLEIGGTAAEDDRLFSTRVLRIPGGATSASFQIAIVNDTVPESSETVIVTMNPPGGVDRGDPQTFTLTIVNDDSIPPPTVRFTAQSQSAAEGAGTVTAVVQLSAASASAVTVPYTLSGTSDAADRSVTPSSPLTIPAGQTSATISIAITSDSANEPDETLVIALGTPTGATLGTPSTHTLTITDDDATPGTPAVSFAAASSSAGENAGTLNIVVQVSPTSTSDITVPFTVGGTATAPGDFSASGSPLVIPANTSSTSIVVTLVDDATAEPTETVVLSLGAPSGGGATLGAPSTHTLSVLDNDTGPPVVRFASADSNRGENAGTVDIVVEVSPASGSDITLPYTIGGSAASPADFTAPASPLVIPAGNTSATLSVSIVDDATDEADETVVVTLGAPSGGGSTLGTPATHTLTIVDDDVPGGTPVVGFQSASSNAAEGAGTVFIRVDVSPTSPSEIRVPFTLGGTASAGSDYDAPGSPLVIAPNATSGSISFDITNDQGAEPDETIVVTLENPTSGGATLGGNTVHTLTIVDDESNPPAQGTLFAITDDFRLLSFDAATPGTVTILPVTGIAGFPLALALDFRPATAELYLYTNDRSLYVVDTATGAASLRGNTPATLNNNLLGLDFDPCTDRIRVFGQNDENALLNADGTLFSLDSPLAYDPGDANTGRNPDTNAAAYTACVGGATTLFGIDTTQDALVRIGSAGGAPSAPDTGLLFTVGPLGISIGGAGQVALDIDDVDGVGYTFDGSGTDSTLFRVNLANGTLTNLGQIGTTAQGNRVGGLAVQP